MHCYVTPAFNGKGRFGTSKRVNSFEFHTCKSEEPVFQWMSRVVAYQMLVLAYCFVHTIGCKFAGLDGFTFFFGDFYSVLFGIGFVNC